MSEDPAFGLVIQVAMEAGRAAHEIYLNAFPVERKVAADRVPVIENEFFLHRAGVDPLDGTKGSESLRGRRGKRVSFSERAQPRRGSERSGAADSLASRPVEGGHGRRIALAPDARDGHLSCAPGSFPPLGPTIDTDTAAGHAVLCGPGTVVFAPGGTPLRFAKQQFRNPSFVASGPLGPLPLDARGT